MSLSIIIRPYCSPTLYTIMATFRTKKKKKKKQTKKKTKHKKKHTHKFCLLLDIFVYCENAYLCNFSTSNLPLVAAWSLWMTGAGTFGDVEAVSCTFVAESVNRHVFVGKPVPSTVGCGGIEFFLGDCLQPIQNSKLWKRQQPLCLLGQHYSLSQ